MTAAFIGATDNLIAMAADTLSWDAHHNPIEVKKSFVLAGRIGVISYGFGPDGVPRRIEATDIGNGTVEEAAKALAATFRDVTTPYAFGLFVAGFDGGDAQVWHIDVPSHRPPRRDYTGPGRVLAGWVAPPTMQAAVNGLLPDLWGRLGLVDDVINLVGQCHQLNKELIGAEVDHIVIDSRGARLHQVRRPGLSSTNPV
jgi:hypothetical protein